MEHKKGFYEKYIKRPQDFLCALLACIVLSPIMLVIAILVKIKIGSPVLFAQERPGLHGEIFKLYKFRTMTNERDANGELLPDEQRLTSFGKLLRSTSLDELPELYAILTGRMAVCGPRPLLVERQKKTGKRLCSSMQSPERFLICQDAALTGKKRGSICGDFTTRFC